MSTIRKHETAEAVVDAILAGEGITISAVSGHEPQSGYAVALSRELEDKIVRGRTAPAPVLDGLIAAYIDRPDVQRELAWPGRFLGVWVADEDVYLDVTQVVVDRTTAVRAAWSREQLAVWDLHNGNEIRTGIRTNGTYQRYAVQTAQLH